MFANVYCATRDTTLNTLLAFIKAMVLYPEVRRKAQAEIDEAVGNSRLPTWQDYGRLHYTRCIMKETLRCMPSSHPVVPILTGDAIPRGPNNSDWGNAPLQQGGR